MKVGVSMTLDAKQVVEIDRLVEEEKYFNRSCVIRKAVQEFLEKEK